jgi:acyl-CoA thioesterase-1
VNPSEAFPAQLQALLRAQGIDAHVINAGVPGDTSPGILARLDSAVPNGTQLVILDRPEGNDSLVGLRNDEGSYIDQIRSRLNARHIVLLVLPNWGDIRGVMDYRDPDGHHFTAEGHALIAAYLLPKVLEILGVQPH